MAQNTSIEQVDRIKKSEQFRSIAYSDGKANGKQMFSIGYGHQIQPNENYLKNEVVSKDWALAQLKKDLKPLEHIINGANSNFTQTQFDSLIDFGYNCGSNALAKVLQTWRTTKDKHAVAAHIRQYVKTTDSKGNKVTSPNLVIRRNENAEAFLLDGEPKLEAVENILSIGVVVAGLSALYLFS